MLALGIDIGGSGIKGAIVETATGNLQSERLRIKTPRQPDKDAVIAIIKDLVKGHGWESGPIGIGFPGVIRNNVIKTAVNLNSSLVEVNFGKALRSSKNDNIVVLNDADAAGYAEMRLGSGKLFSSEGTVLLLTIGTGIGSVLFRNGVLVPNLEFGHVEFKGQNAESYVAERARKAEELSWSQWGKRLNEFLQYLEFLFQPDLIILGGGGVKKPDKFKKYLNIQTPWSIAHFGNRAGIIGAAIASTEGKA